MERDVDREEAVGVAPRPGADPVGHLALDHDDEAGEEVGAPDRPPHDGRRALVREVRDERHRGRRAGLEEEGPDVRRDGVGDDEPQPVRGKRFTELFRQALVELEREHLRPRREEGSRQRAPPGAHLDDPLARRQAGRGDDPLGHAPVTEEVLAETLP